LRRRRRASAALGGALVLALAAGAAGLPDGAATDSPLSRFVPLAAELGDWTVKDGPQAFERDDLFLYIDGGAEIYHEYGFTRVLVQDYWRGEGSISLEIFEMADPAAAFGMFSFKRGPIGEPVPVGSGASLEGYYLNFWKGRFLVTLTGMDASEATVRGILAAARGVDARLDGSAEPPALTAALPPGGLVASSVKYLEGQLGLRNVHPAFSGDAFAFRQAVKGDYADGHSILILSYLSVREAAAALERMETAFRERPRYRGLARTGDDVRVEDEDGRRFLCAARGRALVIVSGAAPGTETGFLDEAAARVPDGET
jgi:hypothetical protein